MHYSVTPSPSQWLTEDVEIPPQSIQTPQDNIVDVTSIKAIMGCTWSDILVSPEQNNPYLHSSISFKVSFFTQSRQNIQMTIVNFPPN